MLYRYAGDRVHYWSTIIGLAKKYYKSGLEKTVNKTTAETNQDVAYLLSNNLARLLREFSRDFERRIWQGLKARGYADVRPSHSAVFANLGLGAVRVTELAERAQVTQQAMGKMLKELERMGYIARDTDSGDKRAKEIRLTERGVQLAADSLEVVAEVRKRYASKIGEQDLQSLEIALRSAVRKIDLKYLPESWADA
jgi:DNA-binding MarR family transcriptional regulator